MVIAIGIRKIKEYLGWNNLNGFYREKTLLSKLREILQEFSSEVILRELVNISSCVSHQRGNNENILRNRYFGELLIKNIKDYELVEQKTHYIFHKRAILMFYILAINYCNDKCQKQSDIKIIGKGFLFINSLLPLIDYGIENKENVSDFYIRNSIFHHTPCVSHSLPRAYIVYQKIGTFDFEEFYANKGFDLNSYFLCVFAIQALFSKGMFFKGSVFDSFTKDYCQKVKNAFHFILNDEKVTIKNFKKLNSNIIYQFFSFRQSPILEFNNDEFACLYKEFLEDLYWNGIYYSVVDPKIKDKIKDDFLQKMGDAFEKYALSLTEWTLKDRVKKMITPKDNPLNDCVIEIEPDWIMVIEFKHTRQDSQTISGISPTKKIFERILYRGTTSGNAKKGLRQLFKRINEFRENNKKIRITPVLIIADIFPVFKESWGTWEEFLIEDEEYKKFISCNSNDFPLLAGIEAWERLLSLITRKDATIKDILNFREKHDGKYYDLYNLVRSFSQVKKIVENPHPLLFSVLGDWIETYPIKSNNTSLDNNKRIAPKHKWQNVF